MYASAGFSEKNPPAMNPVLSADLTATLSAVVEVQVNLPSLISSSTLSGAGDALSSFVW